MDVISIAYYAIVCGILSAVAPGMSNLKIRLAVGAVVGMAAAGLLPSVQGLLYGGAG